MSSRADEFRRRMLKRKQEREREKEKWRKQMSLPEDEERYGFERFPSYEHPPQSQPGNQTHHPLFNREMFLFKTLAAACIILIVAIIFKNESSLFDPARKFVAKSMEQDFQFAVVADWYENQFGIPLALLPMLPEKDKKKDQQDENEPHYALPASGTIIESFEKNGEGIMIETGINVEVEAMNEGIVRFAGVDDKHGKTVIIQHADHTETWYGDLDEIQVNLFDFIKKGTVVGTVSAGNDDTKGAFYFAIKREDHFIDPIQVIQFE